MTPPKLKPDAPTQTTNDVPATRPAPPAPAPAQASAPETPRGSNFHYESLTDDRVNSWDAQGKAEVTELGLTSREALDVPELSNLLQEFFYAVVDHRLSPENAGACVKEILGEDKSDITRSSGTVDAHTLFLDTLAIALDTDADLYRNSLRRFLVATDVSPTLMRQVLDPPILQQLGLIRDTFARSGVRQATNLLYRQTNYNLLREESEGYSKLITEIFTTSSVPPPPPEMAQVTFERVKALIGTFDLDVGRVLDVTLDVAAAVLIKQYKFFVKFLRTSSWWPRSHLKLPSALYVGGLPPWALPSYAEWVTSEEDEAAIASKKTQRDLVFWDRARELHLGAFFELGGRQVLEDAQKQLAIANSAASDSDADFETQWINETNTLPPPGNRVAAQLLGFKLRFYNSELRDEADVLPANLLYLAALLIKIGFISLVDLYPHLSPEDEGMDKVREEESKKLQEAERASRGGPMNALLMAGVLPQGEDDNPNAANVVRKEPLKKAEPEKQAAAAVEEKDNKPNLPEPLEQKVSLLIQLLTIGAIPESLFLLGRFPWIPETFPEVLSRIHRILNVSVEKVYNDSRPKPTGSMGCPAKQMPDLDQSGLPKGSVRLTSPPPKKIWRWPFPDKTDTNESQTYRFYWDEWSDNIPVCQTVDDIFTLCNTFLNISGVNIGKDEALLAKLASIGAQSLASDQSSTNRDRWLELLKRLLLPALSHTKANASVVNAIWGLLKHYPLTTRYALYAEWFEGQVSRMPAMRTAFARATAATRGTMKRVSLTNLSEMAKQLAKTSYSSPGIVFRVAFEQLESYPNLIEAFVECAKYFPDLSYDVLVWSLMNSLGKERSRTQADHALTTSKWLQALSRFTGKVFRRYSLLDATPVLYYVNNQLLKGNSTDLIILKELISSMGGIVDAGDFTDYQVLSMAGGQCLRKHTLLRGGDKRFDNIKSSQRLTHALTDSNLAARLLITLTQYRQSAIYQVPEDEAHIKYLSSIIDDSHQTLIKYLDFLWSNLDQSSFDETVPSIPELIKSYGIDISLAFLVGRANLSNKLFPWASKEADAAKEATKTEGDKDGDVAMDDKPAEEAVEEAAQEATAQEEQKSDDQSSIQSVLRPVIDSVTETMPAEIWEKITPEFYVNFWTLQLGDLYCPEEIYKQEADRLKAEDNALLKDRSDMSRRGQEEKTLKRKELMKLQLDLFEERKEHYMRKAKRKVYLSRLYQTSFPDSEVKADVISDLLLEQCVLPRIVLSPADAEYTFRFIKSLHDWNAPGFRLMSFYNRLFNSNRLRALIFTSTVREADFLGRFLKLVLEDLSKWHKNSPLPNDKDNNAKGQTRVGVYEKEGIGAREQGRLGFALTFDDGGKPLTFVEHAQFKDLLFSWHKNLNNALKSCLVGSEWMHIRNALTVLKTIVDYFPAVDFMASQFTTQLQKITQQEAASKTSPENELGGRVDLSVAAQGAMSELQRRKSKWVMVQAFRPNADGGSKGGDSKLRATASEFKPGSTSEKDTNVDEEDGEVQDGKKQAKESTPQSALPPRPGRALRDSTPNSGQSRSSTPKPNAQAGRGDNNPAGLPDRPPHNLPNRPDVKIPPHYTPDRHNGSSRGHDRRDGRGQRDGHESRDSRDQSRPTRDGERQDRGREPAERRSGEGRGDFTPSGPRNQDQGRNQRQPRGGRNDDRADTSVNANANANANPPQGGQGGDHGPVMNPERAAIFAQDEGGRGGRGQREQDRQSKSGRQESVNSIPVNPDRAALLDQRGDKSGGRSNRNEGRDRGSRNQSPRRGQRQGQDQSGTPGDARGSGRNRERSPGSSRNRGDRDTPRGPDGSGGDRPLPPHQDPNYGRLNPIPTGPETPTGPRPRGRGVARSAQNTPTGPSNRGDGRQGEQGRAPSPNRQPPTGPASGRRRGGHDAAGAHGSGSPAGNNADRHRPGGNDQDKAPGPGVHPDRLAHLGPGGHAPPPPPPPPPGGPAKDSGIPTGPSNERHRGGRRQLAGINNTLQQSHGGGGGQDRSMGRPHQQRQMLGNSDVQVLTGGSQPSTPAQEPPRFIDAPKGPANGDDGSGHGHGRRDHRQDRHGRASHGEFRDRRSTGGPDGAPRDDRDNRRSGHGGGPEGMPPMNPGGGRDRHRGEGGRGPEDWNGNRGGRGGGGGEGGGRREDRGRKRRSEEGLTSDRDKRPRR